MHRIKKHGKAMKQEEVKEYRVQAMSKSELVAALDRTGYRKHQKLFTSLQVRTIFKNLSS